MAQIVWTNNALIDLNEIGEYIATDWPKYTELTVSKLYHKVEVLEEYPRIGRVVPEARNDSLRELIEGNYRIIYEVDDDAVFILTVHHSARELKLKNNN